ncbi:hypothetical protein EIN_411370 [Entamoeba invadens IP1]|uniref:Uncharacterized protein n=1 Tax=Entamoeba invadens IP1 TaxID=370355 RepID=A0A0A1U734_ENTIV|nr:hypothetical protein EIN_411370 [Entamoeba invadens IP1]ELP87784.1 hypothetical protein EIN_411370 [Entamoeba invadens IP1]|eukprot:XP_004254555.1 hypothetical protein EIN_411370 [Entamoeba invadens IP1]
MADNVATLHNIRLQIGTVQQVLEVITLRTETAPIPMYAPISSVPEIEPAALIPVTVQPTELNNLLVQLSDEYFVQLTAKETEELLNKKIKTLQLEEEKLVAKMKEDAKTALETVSGDVRNISEFITEDEYQKMKQNRPVEKTPNIDWAKEKARWDQAVSVEKDLESQGKLQFINKIPEDMTINEIRPEELETPAVKNTIVEHKKSKQSPTQHVQKVVSQPTEIDNVDGIVVRKKGTKDHDQTNQKPKKVSLFKQRQNK